MKSSLSTANLPQAVRDLIFKHFGSNAADWVIDLARDCYNLSEDRNRALEAELSAGDSWSWIRQKFENSPEHFRWYSPRTDSLAGTRYEVMGWLHCLFADANPKVYIDIALEQQKRADEAMGRVVVLESELAVALARVAELEAVHGR